MTNDAIITEGLTQSNLDESQKAFCSSSSQALRLLAPAGSGKTYSLLWRCLNLSATHLRRDKNEKSKG